MRFSAASSCAINAIVRDYFRQSSGLYGVLDDVKHMFLCFSSVFDHSVQGNCVTRITPCSYVVCSCNQITGHQSLSPIDLDRDGNFGPMDRNSSEALACVFNLWEILLLAQEGGK